MKRHCPALALAVVLLAGCGGGTSDQATPQVASRPKTAASQAAPSRDHGIGPVDQVELGPIDPAVATQGHAIFDSKCATCHKIEERYVGPALAGVTTRREPEWILNMILNPAQMIQENETAKQLFTQYLTPMTFQNVTEDDAKAILTYFRSVDAGSAEAGSGQ